MALAIVGMALDGQRDDAVAKMNAECRPLLAALLNAVNEFITYESQQTAANTHEAENAFARDRILILLACAGAIGAAMIWGWTPPHLRAAAVDLDVRGWEKSSDHAPV